MTTPTELSHSPEAILADRSLYTPVEPQDPEFALGAIRALTSYGENFPWTIKDRMRHMVVQEKNQADKLKFVDAFTLRSVEWFVHQRAAYYLEREAWGLRYGHHTIPSSLLEGAIGYEQEKAKDTIPSHVVIPELLDGLLANLGNSWPGWPIKTTYIGNVADNFAERLSFRSEVSLYGNAGRTVGAYSGQTVKPEAKPKLTVHGNVGDMAAWVANVLIMSVDGDAGDELAGHAGYSRMLYDPEGTFRTIVRVEGSAGKKVADCAYGSLYVSCGAIESIGEPVPGFTGSIEVGHNKPGQNHLLYENGKPV